ncbi:MAG TPA: multidrug effflux MFS transporter [Solirubrobacteraceae bacterium]|nr:multidrug effflux MFS transporter [Solirubrobacteraceae bacterium]
MSAAEGTAVRPSTAALRMKPWQQFMLLGALSMFAPLSTDMYLPALPSVAHDLHASTAAVALTLTASMLGLGFGQVVAGPLSDTLGRRRPVLIGIALYTVSSLLCAAAPDVWTLSVLRLLQGAAGAAGIVISRAVVSDLFSGTAAARYFARLMIVMGLAPILAPVIGGELLHVTDWRGIFVVLAGIGAVLLLASWRGLGETLPPEARQHAGFANMRAVIRVLVHDRRLMALTVCYAAGFGAVFAYISGSPFVVEKVFGHSPQFFGLLFGLNAVGLVASSQIGGRIVTRVGPERLLHVGLVLSCIVGAALALSVFAHAGLIAVEACFFLLMCSYGLVGPNTTALALAPFPHVAGSASALMGLAQFSVGAAVAPLVGVAGQHSAVPLAVVMVVMVFTGAGVLAAFGERA